MGLTITEKILANSSGKEVISPGELVWSKVNVAMLLHDAAPRTFPAFDQIATRVWDRNKVVAIIEHMIPAHNIWSAESQKQLREFAKRQNLENFCEMGKSGICHDCMAEQGFVRPGEVVVGVDSDTTTLGALGCFAVGIGFTEMAFVMATGEDWFRVPSTLRININGALPNMVVGKDVGLYVLKEVGAERALYRAAEFGGETIREMSVDSRLTLVNMVDGMSAKSGIIEPDEKTLTYINERTDKPFKVFKSDPDAEYEETFHFDISKLEPQVAVPHLPSNAKPVPEVAGTRVDQVYIGTCTNGRMEDLRMAAKILKGKSVHPDVRLIVQPATQNIYRQALSEGLIDAFVGAGATIAPPSCKICVGVDAVLAAGEVCLSTMNKNFKGRMGNPEAEIYLSNPATAAASAIRGGITDPRALE